MKRRSDAERNALVMEWRFLPLRFARRLPLSEDDRDDAQQVAFLALICAAENWKAGGPTLFQTYAFVAIRNRLRTWMDARERERRHWRKARAIIRRRLREKMRRAREYVPTPNELAAAFTTLTPEQRELLERRERGETFEAIGERRGVTKQDAHWHYKRALAVLRDALEGKNTGFLA